ncbi:MAG: hypothetical protein J6A01_01265 [Proteobacteria bacterium]|nr:hypothetical protein [Pseudomonadota bacterium]
MKLHKYTVLCFAFCIMWIYGCDEDNENSKGSDNIIKQACEEEVKLNLESYDKEYKLDDYPEEAKQEVHDAISGVIYDDCVKDYEDMPYCKDERIDSMRCYFNHPYNQCEELFETYTTCYDEHSEEISKHSHETSFNDTISEILDKYDEDGDSHCSSEDNQPCGKCNNPCEGTTKPICHVISNVLPVCSDLESCPEGKEMGFNGECVSILGEEGSVCSDSSECVEGLTCVHNSCTKKQEESYRYILIEDLSTTCQKTQTGFCAPDAGADIDAIVLRKGGSIENRSYATAVVEFNRPDGVATNQGNSMAANPDKVLGAPDAFNNYPTPDGCYYYSKDFAGDDTEKRQYTFVSLGGLGGRIVVDMNVNIEPDDGLDILELSECKLYNTEDSPNSAASVTHTAEEIRVSISVDGNNWKMLGTQKASSITKGILSFNITAL